MKNKIVLASGNAKKLKEIREMLPEYEVIPCAELGFTEDIEETGTTFYENALIKAKAVSEALGLPALADDSGICVDYLNGEPGIYSARYAGDGVDEHNNELLLQKLKGVENRSARFVCCLVYYKPNGEIITATGKTEGYVTHAPKGENGFGYDPIFFSYDLNECLGVAPATEKNKISHRYRALVALKDKLK